MPSFTDLITPDAESTWRTRIQAFAVAAGLRITNWIETGVGDQIFEMTIATADVVGNLIVKAIRGYASLDTSVDPGDVDPYDADNAARTPGPGYLSSLGQNTYGTTRTESTFANGPITFTNASNGVTRNLSPGGLVFSYANPTTGLNVTYHSTEDATVYTNADGTVTVAPGTSLSLPVQCDIIGSAGTVPANGLSLVTTLLACSGTNPAALIGSDRQSSNSYRSQCRTSNARLSLGGPSAAYEQLAKANIDGTPLLNASGVQVGITRVYVSEDSSTGIVDAYYASDSGEPSSGDVTAANNNIRAQAFAVPDAITFTGQAATPLSVHVGGTAEIEYRAGLDLATIKAAIIASLAAAFKEFPIGGLDRVDGAGSIYKTDLQGIARDGFAGLYKVQITTIVGDSVSVARGNVATLNSSSSDWTITIVTPS